MESNKEEAIRAKEIAEKRLLIRDYAGAKAMALKAKKLFPLDNISQLLAVCEVHCSAQLMANGLHDWYKIIQVEPLSDEIMIRKQYRKLAALLHPDKNKMPGAEAAFKLVGEANNTLSDRAKRVMYDLKRKFLVRSAVPQQNTETNAAYNSSSNLNGAKKWRTQQQPEPQPHQGFTFWTECPGCRSRHQYYLKILSKKVRCINCSRIFTANAVPHLNPRNHPQQFVAQQQPQRSDSYRFTYVRRVGGTARDNTGGVGKPDSSPSMSNLKGPNTIIGQRGKSISADTHQNPNPCSKPNLSLDVNQRRGDAEGTDGGNHAAGTSDKAGVKYNGTGVSSPAKKARGEVQGERDGNAAGTSSCYKPDVKYNGKGISSPTEKTNYDAEKLYEYPDPEFHKFDMCRTFNKFQPGNIWALYSDLDTLPKYYALICKVEHEPLKVHINWLEACPKFDVERAWLGANLPISCGKFRVTIQNTIYDKPEYFSHMVSVKHHATGNYYDILPEVGEIWAVYKNWSAGWAIHDFKTCKFDIVEIREQREESTIVWPLRQVSGFRSVFMPEQDDRTGTGTWEIPKSACILFSHKIPAIRLIDECGGKLEGFWQLDPASVPYEFFYHDN